MTALRVRKCCFPTAQIKKAESVENGLFFSHSKNVLLGDRRTPALKCRFNISRMPFCLIDLEMAQMYCWMQSN